MTTFCQFFESFVKSILIIFILLCQLLLKPHHFIFIGYSFVSWFFCLNPSSLLCASYILLNVQPLLKHCLKPDSPSSSIYQLPIVAKTFFLVESGEHIHLQLVDVKIIRNFRMFSRNQRYIPHTLYFHSSGMIAEGETERVKEPDVMGDQKDNADFKKAKDMCGLTVLPVICFDYTTQNIR